MDIYTTMEYSILHREYEGESERNRENDSYVDMPGSKSFSSTTKKPNYYPSNIPDQFIKNAVTGVEYTWRVGSSDSSRLFKVVDTIGNFDKSGYKIKASSKNYPNPTPNYCYYDSPQQFMTHRKMMVQPEMIERWKLAQERFTD
jgi:hypothetical protein